MIDREQNELNRAALVGNAKAAIKSIEQLRIQGDQIRKTLRDLQTALTVMAMILSGEYRKPASRKLKSKRKS